MKKLTVAEWKENLKTFKESDPDFFSQSDVVLACRLVDGYVANESKTKIIVTSAISKLLGSKKHEYADGLDLFVWLKGRIDQLDAAGKRWVRGRTVVLIPFDESNSSDFIKTTRGLAWKWKDEAETQPGDDGYTSWNVDEDDVVCRNHASVGQKLSSLRTPNDVLYIRGHGEKGQDHLESADHQKHVDVKELVKMLDGTLPKGFTGQVKIYACESAADAERSLSFVQQFANLMREKGYSHCSYYGYSTPASMARWGEVGDSKSAHKWANDKPDEGIRASDVRMRVYPK